MPDGSGVPGRDDDQDNLENQFAEDCATVSSVRPSEALIRVRAEEHANAAGTRGVALRVLANRDGMLWSARQCMDLAYCSEAAAESGVHVHLESLATEQVMGWEHTVILERLPDEPPGA